MKVIYTMYIFQIYLTSGTLYLGVLNVSSFLQVCLITNQSFIGEMLDEDIIKVSKIAILAHGLPNVYENILVNCNRYWLFFCVNYLFISKIMTGNHPFLSKGPYAHFFGGKDVIRELSDEKPGKHLLFLYLASILFNLAIFGKNQTAGSLYLVPIA